MACAGVVNGARLAAMAEIARLFPQLPSVEKVVASSAAGPLLARFSRESVVDAVRAQVDALRERIRSDDGVTEADLTVEAVVMAVERRLATASRRRARVVVNATGVVLHTNLGRALLAERAIAAVAEAAAEPLALEYDVETGRRGDRDRLVEEHLCALTGAQAATVVNNNAAAVLLVLNALADGREVLVSRGELIEIGGSFRIPDIMAKSGAILREVGTTNRTHARDYVEAIGPETAMLLKVHASNYRIVGFTSDVELSELRDIAACRDDVVVCEDLGSGALVDLSRFGLPREPVVGERLAQGADIVTFSGDKLLGGPQCGVIVGRRDLVDRVRANPLKRAVRCDKLTLAALEATLRIYRFDPAPEQALPTLRALTRSIEELERAGREAIRLLAARLGDGFTLALEQSAAQTGSGSQPEVAVESVAVAITSARMSADALAAMFRAAEPPIIGRIERDRFLLDLRTVADPASLVPNEASPAGLA